MGWVITVGHVMNQFLIHIEASNTTATTVVKKDIPANFEDFETVDGLVLENMIETSVSLLTCKLTMIKSRITSLGTNFSDYTKMCLVSEEDLDDLIKTTDKEVNRYQCQGERFETGAYPSSHKARDAAANAF